MQARIQIPGVELESELGRGAHSVVYRGRQGALACAVKIPRAKGRWTRWVYREAVALARVRDRGLPAVYEVGEVDEIPFLLMELVEGETLADRLKSGPLPERETLDIGARLASVLASVHDVRLVHRDVKPRNIVLESGGRVRLIDFGFATPIERSAADENVGTLGYASPEQLHMPTRVDARSDLYTLGRVLAECVLGRLPDARQEPDGELEARGVSIAFRAIIRGLSAHDPARRYADARALLADIDRVRSGRAAIGPRPALQRPHGAFVGREAELRTFARAWADAKSSGGIVVLRGARGGGKSRVLASFSSMARDAGVVLDAKCRPEDAPLAAVRKIIEAYLAHARLLDGADREAAEAALRHAADGPLGAIASLVAPASVEVLGAAASSADFSAGSFAEGAAEIIVRLATRVGPLLLLVDDVQWIDPASREILARLAHRAEGTPLCLVLAARSDAAAAVERMIVGVPSPVTRIDLSLLDGRDTGALVGAFLGDSAIDPAIVRRVEALSDGTPLGIIGVLMAFLDAGAVRPRASAWELDLARVEHVQLPEGTYAVLGNRLAELPPATRRVLDVAAIVGTTFDSDTVARIVGIETADVGYPFADARRAGLVEREGDHHRFVHDTLCELIVAAISTDEARTVHQLAAEILDVPGPKSLASLCAIALHYAAGDIGKTPLLAFKTACAAAEAALAAFDHETAIRFFDLAEGASLVAGVALDSAFHRGRGEAELRLGAYDASLRNFERALERTDDAVARAAIYGRIAWIHASGAHADLAWDALRHAFASVDATMPEDDGVVVGDVVGRLLAIAAARVPSAATTTDAPDRKAEALAELHYQNVRLSIEYNRPLRMLQSALACIEVTEHFGRSRVRARALAVFGIVLVVIGAKDLGMPALAEAQTMAVDAGDPTTTAFCIQLRSTAAFFAGELDRAVALTIELLNGHGHWLEANEAGLLVSNVDMIQTLRGRLNEAWYVMESFVSRSRRNRARSVVYDESVIHRIAALLTARADRDADDRLRADVAEKHPDRGVQGGFHWVFSWGARVRRYVEAGDFGPAFEALVALFESEGHDPATVHAAVSEYYIAVAHARAHQCFRAPPDERPARIAALSKAALDLRTAAKIVLFQCHAVLIDGTLAWFEGRTEDAERELAAAERLGREQSAPWILYGVARVRAHDLRARGLVDAARDQALVAETLAAEHGAEVRARWIREEFDLVPARQASDSASGTASRSLPVARRQLAALLQVVRTRSPSVRPETHGAAILDDVLRNVDAERGVLFFQPDLALRPQLVLARDRRGEGWVEPEGWRLEVLRTVRDRGLPWTPDAAVLREGGQPIDAARVLTAPLFLYDVAVGAVCLERDRHAPAFEEEERELLFVLAHQVPIALEIARLLAEREQLQTSLQQAQKMEAVGQLAGGVAHDFNNMLTVLQASIGVLGTTRKGDRDAEPELALMETVVERAARLTRQLLAFSRHRPLPLEPHDLNAALGAVEAMARRVIGPSVKLSVALASGSLIVKVDRAAFEQAVVNLAVNARDAMPGGGRLTLSTERVTLDESAVRRGAPAPGAYACVAVTDTGQGMSTELLARVFEPFFTTKPVGSGTGLGLATVYSFMKSCGGYVDVDSVVGEGTTFRLFFPESNDRRGDRVVRNLTPPSTRGGGESVLVVDDDPLVARSVKKSLERAGYKVIVTIGAEAALAVVREPGVLIDVAIIDVLMPGMTGPELARRFDDMKLGIKLLFVSGFAPENVSLDAEHLLQKPFSTVELLARVRQLLDAT